MMLAHLLSAEASECYHSVLAHLPLSGTVQPVMHCNSLGTIQP